MIRRLRSVGGAAGTFAWEEPLLISQDATHPWMRPSLGRADRRHQSRPSSRRASEPRIGSQSRDLIRPRRDLRIQFIGQRFDRQ